MKEEGHDQKEVSSQAHEEQGLNISTFFQASKVAVKILQEASQQPRHVLQIYANLSQVQKTQLNQQMEKAISSAVEKKDTLGQITIMKIKHFFDWFDYQQSSLKLSVEYIKEEFFTFLSNKQKGEYILSVILFCGIISSFASSDTIYQQICGFVISTYNIFVILFTTIAKASRKLKKYRLQRKEKKFYANHSYQTSTRFFDDLFKKVKLPQRDSDLQQAIRLKKFKIYCQTLFGISQLSQRTQNDLFEYLKQLYQGKDKQQQQRIYKALQQQRRSIKTTEVSLSFILKLLFELKYNRSKKEKASCKCCQKINCCCCSIFKCCCCLDSLKRYLLQGEENGDIKNLCFSFISFFIFVGQVLTRINEDYSSFSDGVNYVCGVYFSLTVILFIVYLCLSKRSKTNKSQLKYRSNELNEQLQQEIQKIQRQIKQKGKKIKEKESRQSPDFQIQSMSQQKSQVRLKQGLS